MNAMRVAGVLVAAMAMGMGAARSAHAEGAPNVAGEGRVERVFVQAGGFYSGTIDELIPGDHVTLHARDGSVHTIAWKDVVRVETPDFVTPPNGEAPAPPSLPVPVVPTGEPWAVTGEPLVTVTFGGADDARLERLDGGSWHRVCDGPCTKRLPVRGTYRATATFASNSEPFELRPDVQGRARVWITPHGSAGRELALGGGLAVVAGMTLIVLSYFIPDNGHLDASDPRLAVGFAGLFLTVGGVAVAGIGGITMAATPRTAVDRGVVAGGSGEARPLGASRGDALSARVETLSAPRSAALSVPLFAGRF